MARALLNRPAVESPQSREQKRELLKMLLRRQAATARSGRLSLEQRRLFTLYLLDPRDNAYNLLSAYEIAGRLAAAPLRQGLAAIVGRHAALRTVFDLRDGEPVQLAKAPGELAYATIDLRALAPGRRRVAAHAAAIDATRRPFDLIAGPAYRFRLLRLDDDLHLLLLVFHHLVADVWSFKVFNDELAALYAAGCRGEASPLAPLAEQYGDFCVWEHRQFDDRVLAEETAYWRRALAGMEVSELPGDLPRPPIQTHRGARHVFQLGAGTLAGLERIARQRDLSPFMGSLAVFLVLIHRYTGRSDVNCGIPVSNRTKLEAAPLIGFFVNTVVVRADLGGDPSFHAVLERLQEPARAVYASSHLPFDGLVEALRPRRDSSRNPLYQITFQTGLFPPLRLAGLAVSPIFEQDYGIVRSDLELYLGEDGRAIVVYNRDLYHAATIAALARRFRLLCEGIVAAPERPLADLPWMSEAERHAVVFEHNDTATLAGPESCIHQLFARQAAVAGEAVAAVFGGAAISYGELDRRANRLARYLQARGVGPEAPVGMLGERSLEMLAALFGILKAGGAYVPISPGQPPERLAAILADSGARLVLAWGAEPGGEPRDPHFVDLAALDLAAFPATAPASATTERNLAYAIYTSGSTGRPKGVLVEHRSAVALAGAMDRLCYRDLAGQRLRLSLNAPLDFDASMQQIVMLTRGHCLVIVPDEVRLDGPAFVRFLAERGVEALDCTPSHLALLLDAGILEVPRGSLRKILAAGGAIDRPMWDRLAADRRVQSYDIYGPTECTVNATGQRIDRPGIAPRIGTPLAGYAVHLLDAHLKPVPPGVVGEIFIGGQGVCRGYLARPDLTAGAFVPDPFGARGERLYRSGDYARRLAGGALEFIGRRDDQVKIRGRRIELGEIQARLVEQQGVRQAAVVMHRGATDGQLIVAYVVPAEPHPRFAERVRDELSRHCPEYMLPGRIVVVDDLPLTASGKLDRAALPEPAAAAPATGAAVTDYEQLVIDVWADAFGISRSRIGVESSFFELGGHSLLATRIAARLSEVFQVEAPPRLVLSHPTVRELGKIVAGLRRTAARPAVEIRRVAHTAPAPLSFAQERIWFLEQLEPGLTAYNVPVFLRLRGRLDAAALAASWRHLVARHEALRTVFRVVEGKPVQHVVDHGEDLPLPRVDLSGLSSAIRENAALRLARDIASLTIGLDVHPLFRIVLARLGAADHLLLLCLHHVVADAWSIRILLDELGGLYAGFLAGIPAVLPEISLTGADYAVWQRQALSQEVMEEQLRFWRSRLDVAPPVLTLPADRPRAAVFRYRGGNVRVDVTGAELDRLVGAAARHGITPFMFLTAAVQLVLSRTSGEGDVWIGSPVANRAQAGLGSLVGLLINIVVLRGRLGRRQSVGELLAATRLAVLDAFDHQDLPFEKVVEALNPDRSLSHSPLFQCMLSFISRPEIVVALAGVEATELHIDNGTAKLDLTFDLGYTGERLGGRIEYNGDLFDRATALRLAAGLRAMLDQLAGGAERTLGELSLLRAAERFQLVHEWNDTARERHDDPCIHHLFERQARAAPDRIAVVCGAGRLSYGELERRANRLAHLLVRTCRSPRARVGVYLRRSADMAVALLGVLKAGKCYVPLDAGYPQARISRILETSEAELVLTDGALGERLAAPAAQVRLDGAALAAWPSVAPAGLAAPDDLAYVIFTSGSTGAPKGVVLQHRPVVNLVEWVNETFAVGPGDTLLFVTSLCFDLSVYDVFGTLAAGATIHLADDDEVKDPELLVELLCSRRITFWDSAPAALSQLQPFFDRQQGRGSLLRLVFLSGDWIPLGLPPAVAATFPRARVIGLGGATEAAIWSNVFPIGEIDKEWTSIPYGRPIRNARYLVLDGDLEPCAINVPGDLYIGGGCLSIGYINEPVLTARQYLPDPLSPEPGAVLYATGDRARWRRDGNVEFLGRLDAQVKIRGFRIELGEIETALESHPAVGKAVVLARADRPGDRRLVAYVQAGVEAVARRGRETEEARSLADGLLAWLRSKLPEYMIPGHVVLVDGWPLTQNGKLDRRALPAPEMGESETAFAAAESAAQETLAGVWAEVLGLARVGIHDNFFALGGDSIMAIQVVARANQLGLRVRARDFFQTQTVAEMLPRAAARETEEAVREAAVAEAALTPIQRWFFAQQLAAPHHFNQAVLLEWKEALDVPRLLAALARLCAGHDSLRLRFFAAGAEWRQAVRGPEAENLFAFRQVDLGRVRADTAPAALEACASQVQGTLNIFHGPLVAACLFHGRPQRLLLVVHHLAIDGVSWRFLLDDLARLYAEPAAGPLAAGRPGGSWMSWAGRIDHPDFVERHRAEEAWWLRQGGGRELACDFPGGRNLAGSAATAVGRLSREETEQLERRVPAAYRTGMMDVLLAALVRALGEGTESAAMTIDLESHGRTHELGDGDVSRTVGWFTSLYPLKLAADGAAATGALLKSVKEQLRAVPREGAGYGVLRYLSAEPALRLAACRRPDVLFNYLGRFDQALVDNQVFRLRTDLTGQDVGPGNARTHRLEVTSLVIDGCFETRWRFSRTLHRAARIERLVARFLAALRAIVAHCLSAAAGGRTPSDFPLARIGQPALDALLAEHPGLADLYPATAMQQGMLFHGELDPDGALYVQQVALDIHGELDLDALRSAWSAAIGRHACLRTLFVVADGRHLQAVLADHGSFWAGEDWSRLPVAERQQRLEDLGRDDLGRRFAVAHEPPFRVTVARLAADRHHLLVSFHHAILDGWSLAILFEEVSELYQAARQQRPPALAAARPLRDHAAWLAERDPAMAHGFWQSYLAGFDQANPMARAGWTQRADRGSAVRRLGLPRSLVEGLDRYARRQRLTRSTIFQAAWAILVGRTCDAADVVVGVTTSGREQGPAGIERMLGLFISTLPLRVAVDDSKPVGAWLRDTQDNLLAVRERELSSLSEVQAASDLGAGQPLFETLVVVENYPFGEALVKSWLGLRSANIRTYERANYPLSLLVELRSAVTLGVSYEARCFDGAGVCRMLGHLENLLTAIAEDRAPTLAGLAMLSAGERHQLVCEANDSRRDGAPAGCLHELIGRQAERTPERIAVAAEDGCLTYRALMARSAGLARTLVREGVAPGDRVGLLVERSVEAVAAILGVLRAGAAYVPIDLENPGGRIAWVLADSGARRVLAKGWPERSRAGLPAGVRVLDLAALGPAPAGGAGLPAVDPGQAAYVIYTSGSTGRPKGVVIDHTAVLNLLHGMQQLVYRDTGAGGLRLSVNAPFAFDASVQQIAMLCLGHTLDVLPEAVRRDGAAFLGFLASHQIEGLDITPTHLGLLLEAGLLARQDLALRRVVVAGGAIDQAMWNRLASPDRRFFDIYGPTEATVNASGRAIDAPGAAPSIGRPLANYRLQVLDRAMRPAALGVAGQLFLGGPGLAHGYLGRPGLTAERFVPDPFAERSGARLYQTGDLARRFGDGELEFLGRIDHQVKVRGFRVELGEIESVMLGCAEIVVAAVILDHRPAGVGGAVLVAFYTGRDGRGPAPEELRALVRRQLPEPMVPNDFIRLERMPVLASGKVAREELRGIAAGPGRPRVGPRNRTEERLVRLWSEVLGVDAAEVGVGNDFLSLGGHSLNALSLLSRLRSELGAEVPLKALYEGQTIGDIAEQIAGREAELLASRRAAELLSELQGLTPEAVRALLEQEKG